MSTKLKTIKVTERTVDNLNFIAFHINKNQYEASELASEEKRKAIENRMRGKIKISKTKKQ